MKTPMNVFLLLFGLLIFNSCAEQKIIAQKVETQITEMPKPKPLDIAMAAREHIFKSPNLTSKQKNDLISIQEKADVEINSISTEIDKTKMVLINSAFDSNFNAREVEILKRKIMGLEKKKIRLGLNAFTEARKILHPEQIKATNSLNKIYFKENFPNY